MRDFKAIGQGRSIVDIAAPRRKHERTLTIPDIAHQIKPSHTLAHLLKYHGSLTEVGRGDGDGDVGALGIAVRREGDAVAVLSHRKIGGQLINRLRCPIDQLECTTDCIPLARKLACARFSVTACGQLDAACCSIGYGR